MPTQDIDPSDFIDSSTPIAQEVSPSQWIYDFAGLHSKKWVEKNHDQRMEALFAAVIAYLDTKWLQDKKK